MRISSELNASQMTSKSAIFVIAVMVAFASSARAQILPREDKTPDAGTEDLYDKFENQESKNAQKKNQEAAKKEKTEAKPDVEPNNLSELGRLSPFEDIAVIQKRYLPKTGRFEIGGGGSFSTNNAFFNDIGANLRLGYYFSEKYGIEGIYQYISSSKRPITSGLIDHESIQTESLVEPKGFYGAMFKWSPIYGKMAWFQQKIVPFDIYFTPGIGMTQTVTGGTNSMVMLGAGQLFALSKSFAVRWDFNWNYYSSSVDVTTGGVTSQETKTHSDLFLGVGVSFFFPEATYR